MQTSLWDNGIISFCICTAMSLKFFLLLWLINSSTYCPWELLWHLCICILAKNFYSRDFFLSFFQKNLLLDCETQIESLLANVFENYKSLDEDSPTGLADFFDPMRESAAPALAPAIQVYSLLHDILSLDAQTMLGNYFQVKLQTLISVNWLVNTHAHRR